MAISRGVPTYRIPPEGGVRSHERTWRSGCALLSSEPGPGQVVQLVEQRTENQLPGRAASALLALTRCCLAATRDKPSRAVAVVPSCSECESHSLSHCGR